MSAISTKDNTLSTLICHSMLKLYMELAYSARRLTQQKKNQCVARYLKSVLKDRQYKSVKSSIRELIHYAKKPTANIETKLTEVQRVIELNQITSDETTDLGRFISMLCAIDKVAPLSAEPFVNRDSHTYGSRSNEDRHTYADDGFLSDNFNNSGKVIKDIALTIPKAKEAEITKIVKSKGWCCHSGKEYSVSGHVLVSVYPS